MKLESVLLKQAHKFMFGCISGKNGVYCDLVKNVREAFEECELVRINCQGMNGSDFRKIGGKLKVTRFLLSLLCNLFFKNTDNNLSNFSIPGSCPVCSNLI